MAWTAEQRIAIAKAFYEDGESAGIIADRFGTTRNAVIGLAHRHAAAEARRTGAAPVLKRAPTARKANAGGGRGSRRGRPKAKPRMIGYAGRAPGAAPAAEPAAPALPVARHIPIVAAGAGECRFAVTPHGAPREAHRFCGAPTGDPTRSYCPHHHAIAHA